VRFKSSSFSRPFQNRNEQRFHDSAIQIADPAPILFSGDSDHDSDRLGMGKA
jgi:hypothetical protein